MATRVAEERGEDEPGKNSVGYVVRGDSAVCNECRLLFCTTGVLLRQLQNESALECITHVSNTSSSFAYFYVDFLIQDSFITKIVVDEVHERNLDSDILLGLLKRLLPSYPHIQVILMSATLDADRFASYWGTATPHVHIPGRTFPVLDFSLEDVLKLTGFVPPKNKKKGKGKNVQLNQNSSTSQDDVCLGYKEETLGLEDTNNPNEITDGEIDLRIEDYLGRMDEGSPDVELIACLVRHLIVNNTQTADGSILIFLAGVPEINSALEAIKRKTNDLFVRLLPLHGGLQPKEQRQVFQQAPKGCTKIICSTNVAETSVTIPDCTVVIDS